MSEKYIFVRGGVTAFRPANRFVEFVVDQDQQGLFRVEGVNQVGNDFIREQVTPTRATQQEAEQDLLRLYARLIGDNLAFDPSPTEAIDLNLR